MSASRLFFAEKILDKISRLVLYREFAQARRDAHAKEKLSMLTSWIYKEHSTKWQPRGAMRGVVCALGLSLSAVNNFGGRLGQETSIDSRHIRQ